MPGIWEVQYAVLKSVAHVICLPPVVLGVSMESPYTDQEKNTFKNLSIWALAIMERNNFVYNLNLMVGC